MNLLQAYGLKLILFLLDYDLLSELKLELFWQIEVGEFGESRFSLIFLYFYGFYCIFKSFSLILILDLIIILDYFISNSISEIYQYACKLYSSAD